MQLNWRRCLSAGVALVALMWATTARASIYVVGSPLSSRFDSALVVFQQHSTVTNTVLPEPGANVRSPVDGTVVAWRLISKKGGPFFLRVLEPHPDGRFTALSTSAPGQPAEIETVETFSTKMPIRAGDAIAVDNSNPDDQLLAAGGGETGIGFWKEFLIDGTTRAPELFSGAEGAEVAFDAIVVARPAVTLLGTATGSVRGNAEVRIAGRDLGDVTGVSFGGTPAGFAVVSENLIAAKSPPASRPGPVDVTVTSPGGQSSATEADQFTYVASCVVPKLKGKSLKAARKLLRREKCALGRVTGPTSPGARVKKQGSKPGSVLPAGTKVGVGLG